jgi:hypothetical protein
MRRGLLPGRLRRERAERAERADLARPPMPLSLRDEKIILTLVVQTQQLNDRLTRLEDRFDASQREAHAQPDQQDLLELRMHSARLAAELSRVTIELRAEINELAEGVGGATGADAIAPPGLTDRHAHEAGGDEPLIDLRESRAARSRPYRSSGWRPARTPAPPPGDD